LKKKITQLEINSFINLSGDRNPIHTNLSTAKTMGYGKIVAHGMLSEIYLSSIIGNDLPGPGSLWVDKKIKFKKIVRVNDQLTFVAEIKEIYKSTNIVIIQINCFNQFNELIFESENSVLVNSKNVYEKKLNKNKTKKIKKFRINLKNKTAIVLGASGGIGFEVVKKLLIKKFNVIAFYYSNDNDLRKIAKKNKKLRIFKLDIKNKKSLTNSLKVISNIFPTHFINCYSPKIYPVELKKILKKDFDHYLDETFFNIFRIIETCIDKFKRIGLGNIVDISSIFLKLPQKTFLPYIVYKGAMHGLIKSLAIELSDFKIRVNSVGAGITNTQQISDMTKKQKLIIAAKTPLQKIADPKDIANAVYFLASDESDFITGTTIDVNGGQV